MSLQSLEAFESYRARLIGLAYRITGSASEAEDIVQEAYIKFSNNEQSKIHSPYSWLVTVTTRMALDHLKSARVQREVYVGPWLPEPFVLQDVSPEETYELDQSITMALMVLLEQLSPSERVAYILHDLFQFSFEEIGGTLNKSGAACRKLASRAREKIGSISTVKQVEQNEHHDVVEAFFSAVKDGDVEALATVLSENVTLHADGGGKAPAAKKILSGSETVAKFLSRVVSPSFAATDAPNAKMSYVWFNGSQGFVVWEDNKPISAFNFEIRNNRIDKIHVLRNPDKLRFFRNMAY